MARYPRVAAAIKKLFGEVTRHDWSLEELRSELAKRGVSADRSSVSRALNTLVSAGVARRLTVRGTLRFEDARHHHDHLRCERCGAVQEISCSVVNAQLLQVARSKGFRLLDHELVLIGVCPSCSACDTDLPPQAPQDPTNHERPASRLDTIAGT